MFSLLGILLTFLIELLVINLNHEVNDFLCIIIVFILINNLGNIF